MGGLISAHGVSAGDAGARPALTVADASQGCPTIAGSFVALLDPARGILLLSGDSFPGARRVGEVDGRVLRAELGVRPWSVAAVGMDGGSPVVWGSLLPFRTQRMAGCVAFDRDRFSSEGDLASYLYWLVEEVYAGLPEAERTQFPAFRLANREVRLEVRLAGFSPMPLAGREGSTVAFKVPGGDRTFLLQPFILGDDGGRVAVRVSYTDGEYFSSAEKPFVGTVVVAHQLAVTVGDPSFEIRLTGIV
jgi:hypothetical protein